MLVFVLSCSENDSKTIDMTSLGDFQTYKIDMEQNEAPIFDFIKEVEFVRLQETNESLSKSTVLEILKVRWIRRVLAQEK